MKSYTLILLVVLWSRYSYQADQDTYRAAVAEYSPQMFPLESRVQKNVENLIKFVEEAATQKVDIIVFPELGLIGLTPREEEVFSYVPDPQLKKVPCNLTVEETSQAMVNLSCTAAAHHMYLVVNLPEKYPCSSSDQGCPTTNHFHYNTNVVFDRNGAVIVRYRKYNLFGEDGMNITDVPEHGVFDTDFNVRIGTFICFDILFDSPADELVMNYNVTQIAFSTAWFSEMPFLTAIQAQAGFAHKHKVNFLASGFNFPNVGSGGSGFYIGNRSVPLVAFPSVITKKLLIADIPTTNTTSTNKLNTMVIDMSDKMKHHPTPDIKSSFYLKKDDLTPYTNYPIVFTEDKKDIVETICNRGLCCDFEISVKKIPEWADTTNYYVYHLVVFNGVRTFSGVASGGIQVCSIIQCLNQNLDQCAELNSAYTQGTIITSVKISGVFQNKNSSQFPNTLLTTQNSTNVFDVLQPIQYQFNKTLSNITMKLNNLQDDQTLVTFGIYGRAFDRDGLPPTGSHGAKVSIDLMLYIVLSVLCVYNIL